MVDQVEQLVDMYDAGHLSRRQLIQAIAVAAFPLSRSVRGKTDKSNALTNARTFNHVTLYPKDVAVSSAFYRTVAGLPVAREGRDFCELRLKDGFLGLYAADAQHGPGFDHLCFGVENYDAEKMFSLFRSHELHPTLEHRDQIYVRDPDGVRIQFASLNYKV